MPKPQPVDGLFLCHEPIKGQGLASAPALDLVLTELMRGEDEEDLSDAAFLIRHDGITRAELQEAIAAARVPGVPELQAAFEQASRRVLDMAG